MEDMGFVLFSLAYVFFLSKIAFPSSSTSIESPIFGEKNRILGIYVSVAALIGLFLPIIYIFHGIIKGDKQGIKAAAPHVFLLASQVFMEGLTFSGRFSIPIRVFVPVFYNTKRIFTIVDWMRAEIGKVDVEDSGSDMRLHVGRALAVANMAFWCFNLFGFLLPVYLPKAFKRYYGGFKVKE
ncbi:transmembrane protein [Thalictrum thalictroides]|uniref:Transmembrane protein n=1 Tax=Thalictrum thalictroides TaxID=46969 RepID=A0A7J6UVG1_THATH|nr:transmembrane protein [Thalictrum thalictroides]